MVIEGSPTKAVAEETKPIEMAEANGKEELKTADTGDGGDSDTEFTVETAEMEELDESSSDSDGEEDEAVQENFTIEVQDGEAKKLKFPPVDEGESQEAETQESQGLEVLENTMDDEDDENDKDFNPCHVSYSQIFFVHFKIIINIQDTLSDIEVNDDDEMAESDPEVEDETGTHKKTGAVHQRKTFLILFFFFVTFFCLGIKVKNQMEVPPAEFECESTEAAAEPESDSKMEE